MKQDSFYTEAFYTKTLLHRAAFTHRSLSAQKLLHTLLQRGAFTQTPLRRAAFTHRSIYTEKPSDRAALHTRKLFTHRNFYTQTLLQKAVAHRSFYTEKPLHRAAFTRRSIYTEKPLHTDAFIHRRFCTQTLLHTGAFPHESFYTRKHKGYPKQRKALMGCLFGPVLGPCCAYAAPMLGQMGCQELVWRTLFQANLTSGFRTTPSEKAQRPPWEAFLGLVLGPCCAYVGPYGLLDWRALT